MSLNLFLILTLASAQILSAQGTSLSVDTTAHSGDPFAIARLDKIPLSMTPETIELAESNKNVVVHIKNTYRDTITVKASILFAVPSIRNGASLITTDSAVVDSAAAGVQRSDSLANHWSLENWIGKIPVYITVAPGQTVDLPIPVKVPAKIPAGEYSAHLVLSFTIPGVSSFSYDGKTEGPKEPVYMDFPLDVKPAPAFVRITYRAK